MTVLVSKRTAKMKLGDITVKPDKKTGWWCLMDSATYLPAYNYIGDKLLRYDVSWRYGLTINTSKLVGKVASAEQRSWRGTTLGFRNVYKIFPEYTKDGVGLSKILSYDEYKKLLNSDMHIPSVGYVKYVSHGSMQRYIALGDKYVRLPFKPTWIALSELDNTPLETVL